MIQRGIATRRATHAATIGAKLHRLYAYSHKQSCVAGKAIAFALRRATQPVTITTAKELQQYIDCQARLFIHHCVDPDYAPAATPPAAAYATICALLWQHSLHSWHALTAFHDHAWLCQCLESRWLRQCQKLLDASLGTQESDRLVLRLRVGFHHYDSPSLASLSQACFTGLQPYFVKDPGIGLIRMQCMEYLEDWQAHVSSYNLIRILLLEKNR